MINNYEVYMTTVVCGSFAYDNILKFEGKFEDHLIGSELNEFLIKGSPFSIDLVIYLTLLGVIPLLFKKYIRF